MKFEEIMDGKLAHPTDEQVQAAIKESIKDCKDLNELNYHSDSYAVILLYCLRGNLLNLKDGGCFPLILKDSLRFHLNILKSLIPLNIILSSQSYQHITLRLNMVTYHFMSIRWMKLYKEIIQFIKILTVLDTLLNSRLHLFIGR